MSPLLTEIPRLAGMISEEFIKDVLAKVWEEMGIWNPRCPIDAWRSHRGSLTLIENFLDSSPIYASPMNSDVSLNFCTFSAFCASLWITPYFLQTYSTNTKTGIEIALTAIYDHFLFCFNSIPQPSIRPAFWTWIFHQVKSQFLSKSSSRLTCWIGRRAHKRYFDGIHHNMLR